MADPAPAEQPGENFFEPISPEGREPPPSATVQVHDSERVLREMPPQDAREIFGEEITAEWSPEQAVEELRKQRSLQNSQPSRTVKFDFDSRRGELSDKAAASDLSFSRRVEHANRLMEALPGIGPERAVATASEALTGGHIHQFELNKEDRAGPLSHGDSPQEAADRLRVMREQRAQDLANLTEQLAQPVEQPSLQTEQPPQVGQPPPSQPEQPALDPVEQARAQAEAARASYYSQAGQASQVKWELERSAKWVEQQAVARYAPQIQAAGGVEKWAQQNPAGFSDLKWADNFVNTCRANVLHCDQVEALNLQKANELQASRAQQEHVAWAAEQDKLVERAIPELANPEAAPALQRAALDTLKGAGITEQELRSLWNGEQTLNLRDHRAQAIISKAAKWDAAQAKAKSARPEPLPQVMRPGVALSKGEINAGDQSARLSRLGYLFPTDAMKEGAKLLSERRGRR